MTETFVLIGRKQNKLIIKKAIAILVTLCTIALFTLAGSVAVAATAKKPTMKSVKATSSSSITIKWKKASKANGYAIYQKEGSGKYKRIATVSKASKISYTKKGLKSATKYSYKIKSYNIKNGKKVYSDYSKVKSAYTKPSIPTSVKAKAQSKTSIKVSWKKISKADGYVVYQANGQKYKKIATLHSREIVSYTMEGLNNKQKYTFAVCSYIERNGKAIFSETSKGKSATTSKPKSSVNNNSSDEMVWIPTKGGTKYHIRAKCSNMSNPIKVTEAEAISQGFDRCKRCYK